MLLKSSSPGPPRLARETPPEAVAAKLARRQSRRQGLFAHLLRAALVRAFAYICDRKRQICGCGAISSRWA